MAITKQFDCTQCGAQLEYDPDVGAPACPYCGHEEAVVHEKKDRKEAVEELDYLEFLQKGEPEEMQEQVTVQCEAWYAKTTLDPHVTASECPFCGTQIVTQGESERVIKPKSMVPFSVGKQKAIEVWQAWIQGLWFAPNKLKSSVKDAENLAGIYIPHWTYDAETQTAYDGERGDDYWVKENGEKKLKVKWRRVSGDVYVPFDDVLVVASDG
ncbi:hypothetical protein KKF84_01295, partial [Myxococcota bacterium]|nr:hypothetical protein [Myxococcota bacterium]MBU1533919.1 hypothetical protein [Myxococcota bacterium]